MKCVEMYLIVPYRKYFYETNEVTKLVMTKLKLIINVSSLFYFFFDIVFNNANNKTTNVINF